MRVEMTIDLLNELGYIKESIKPDLVTPGDLEFIHDGKYIDVVEKVSCGEKLPEAEDFGLGTLDNPIIEGMAKGARNQAGGTLLGARLLIESKAKKVLQLGGGFHHAQRDLAAGFCIYNDLALAIQEMIGAGWHVVYLDLDVHHGDGVQQIFYSSENVMTISLHESGEYLFPGTGWLHELGKGMGRSLKLNLPLEPFTEGDSYLEVLNGAVVPALTWFKPDAIIVQAGADAHYSDPLADLMLTTQDFEIIYRRVIEIAEQLCKGKILFTLGGGYALTATPRIWSILYMILLGKEIPTDIPYKWREKWQSKLVKPIPKSFHDPADAYEPIPRRAEITKHNRDLIRRLLDAVAPDWL